ncbi:MAG: hypothetical protein JRH18_02910 [Deltaproteobacteria bacterium]|nr:hypothetical protein [Deltaproteobacteria bacterium]MBW2150599.1 hypothetical protein [Deltaproteobacteria bacterium]
MEDLPRDLEKAIRVPHLPKQRKRKEHWTLLFVGDHGKVIRFRGPKALLITWVFSFVFFAAASITLFFLYQNLIEKNLEIKDALITAQKKAKSLRNEKEILLARAVVAESQLEKIKKMVAGRLKKEPSKQPVETTQKPAQEKKKTPGAEPQTVTTVYRPEPIEKIPSKTVSKPHQFEQETISEKPSAPIDVEDFFAIVEPSTNTVRIKYKIRNTNKQASRVSGHTFMVLKPNDANPEKWLILPSVPLVAGKPSLIGGGRSFSISRFKTIRFKAPYQNDTEPFTKATVLVYATTGELLLEKSFPIHQGKDGSHPAG